MSSPWRRFTARAHYGAGQAARIVWYTGHYIAGRAFLKDGGVAALGPAERTRIRDSFRALFADDLASIESGEYKMPASLRRPPSLAAAAAASLDYLSDARAVGARRARHGHSEVLSAAARARYPRYYLQNFHYQSDGWLSAESAARYDMQVETLFTGAGDAMRRRALPAIRRALGGRDPATARLVDLGCGDGGFLAAIRDNWPSLRLDGVDLSPAYLARARVALAGGRGVALREAAVEATGLGDAAFDVAT
ncbi:MAG: class I SAM-dependent methyltransferase, partial [Parvularculaceae bacterium]|nr:class I SAM-dependent methyltransferase [Parvularculaceae bacterium]